ncbi:hypothetical protein HDU83_000544 [Entophlyctis luteolus]|nr:hypothetical protein HDU83_000544 [Entophlyctis luteolus]
MEKAKFLCIEDQDVQACLFKWGMKDHLYLKRFAFDQKLNEWDLDRFVLEFFNNPNVNPHLRVLGTKDRWGTLGKVNSVEKEETLHSVTSLTFFDRLSTDAGVVRKNGTIRKCLEEYQDGFAIGDELRKCLLCSDSDNYTTFSDSDRQEFIFHIFKALCLGGQMCQYEDEIDAYLSATKKLYKDMVSVGKDAAGRLYVTSRVFRIIGVDSSVSPLFPLIHPQNFCYMSVDAGKRLVNILYHASSEYF